MKSVIRRRGTGLVLVLALALALAGVAACRGPGPDASPSTTTMPGLTTAPPSPSEPATTSPPPTTVAPTTRPPGVPGSLLGKDLERLPTSAKLVALTFDAGANADGVGPILATLAQKGVAGTFFLTGDFVSQFPQQSRQIVGAGHRVGNHTIDHPHLPSLPDSEVRAQVLGAAQAVRSVTGADPAPFFRFPYGDRTAHTIALINDLGYVAVRWSVDSLGWQGTMGGTRGATFVRDRVLNAAVPGGIVLMHVGSHPEDHSTLDADALSGIIDGLRAQGYTFVTLDALLT